MSWNRQKELDEQRSDLIAELSKVVEKSEGEKRSLTGEEKAVFDRIKADLAINETRRSAIKEVEDLKASIKADGEKRSVDARKEFDPKGENRDQIEKDRNNFRHYILTGEMRDISTGSQGVVAPGYFNTSYIEALKASVGLVTHGAIDVPTDDMAPFYLPYIDDTGNTSQVKTEGATADPANDPTLAAPYLGAFRYTPGALTYTIEMAKTNFFAFETVLQKVALNSARRKVNTDSVVGDGSNKIRGFLHEATVGAEAGGGASSFDYDSFQDMVYSMDPSYRNDPSTVIFVNSAAKKICRAFADDSGRLLYGPNEAMKFENIPIIENGDMPALELNGVGAAIVTCSNYFLRSVRNVEIVVDRVTAAASGKIKLHIMSWHDGRLVLPQAVRTLELTSS